MSSAPGPGATDRPHAKRPAATDQSRRAQDPGRVSIVEEPTRKGAGGDPRREPTGPVHERDAKPARAPQQKVVHAEPQRGREALDPRRFAGRNAAVPSRTPAASSPGRNARSAEPAQQRAAHSMAPRARAAEELSYRAPAPDVSRTSRSSDDPRKNSLAPGRARRNSDDPRGSAPELRGTNDADERDYEFAAPQATPKFDEPDYEFAAPRASAPRPSQREIVPPAARPRHPSQSGPAAPSGAFTLHCEIDGIAVIIEPTDLSAAGLFVPTPIPPPLDSEVRVFLRIGEAEFEASGHIVQSVTCEAARKERKRPGFGLLFTHIEDDVRGRLRDAIDALLSERTERLRGIGASSERPVSKPAPAIDPREHEILDRLRGELEALKSQPPWSVLGISQGSEVSCVREAFFAASKRYHPHVYARYALPEIKDVVTQLFIAYKRAFTSMTKTGRSQRNASGGRAAGSGNPPGRSSDPGNK